MSGAASGDRGRYSGPRWRRRRWVRWLAWLGAAVLAFWGVTWLALPPLIKWQAQKIATEKLGRPVRIGAVQFRPWSLELTLREVSVGGVSPADPPQLTVQRLYANLELESALRLAPVLEAIQVDEPALRLRYMGGGHYDVDDIIARLTRGPKPPPDEKPVHFALYNIAVQGGRVTFTDDSARRTHEVRDLRLTLPFISNLPSQREVHVTPQLAFTVDGSRFDSGAQALPFDASRRTEAHLKLQHLDLAPYLAYQPASLPLRATAGVLDADVRLAFEQTPKPALKVAGTAGLSGVKVETAAGEPALAFDRLTVEAREVRPLDHAVHLARVTLTAPRVLASRDAQGRINWGPASGQSPSHSHPATPARTAASAARTARASGAAPASAARAPSAADDWRVTVDHLAIAQGDAQWRDARPVPGEPGRHGAAQTPARVHVAPFSLEAQNVTWPVRQPATFSGRIALADVKATPDGRPTAPAASANPDAAGRAVAVVSASASSAAAPASAASAPFIAFQGQAQMSAAQVSVQARGLPLRLAQPYLSAVLKPSLTGDVDADADIAWNAPPSPGQKNTGHDAPGLVIEASQLALSHLALTGDAGEGHDARAAPRHRRPDDLPPGTLARLEALTLEGAKVDLPGRSVAVDAITVQAPRVRVARDRAGRWMFEDWLAQPAAASAQPDPGHEKPLPPWRVQVGHVAVADGGIGWRDQQPALDVPGVVDVTLSQVKLDARHFDWHGGKPFPLEFSALLASRRGEPGKLAWRGAVGLTPVSAQGEVDAERLPMQAFTPYVAGRLNIDILRADASFKGKVDYAAQNGDLKNGGPRLHVTGDARIEELRTASHPGSAAASDAADRVGAAATVATAPDSPSSPSGAAAAARASGSSASSPSSASARPVRSARSARPVPSASAAQSSRAALAPGDGAASGGIGEELLSWKQLRVAGLDVRLDPGKAPRVEVRESQLSDFYARIIVHPNGRINLQDLVKTAAPAQPEQPASGASAAASAAALASAPVAVSAVSAASAASGAQPDAPVMHFGPTRLTQGQVSFSDHFIRPNYSADLTGLSGALGAFSSVTDPRAPQMADLTLTGRAQGTAQLTVNGKLNPLAQPLALDIAAKVTDLELPPLSPYSVKYSGHGIERGKLSMDVTYKIAPDGQLTASNRLVLNQLQFGEQVPGAPASLPVTLATALLADGNGVIDLDLPISGSLNDPQFSLGPIIIKAIFNLIGKAITAPFSLLAHALGGGGGGDDLSQVPFAPGSASLSGAEQAQLAKIAQAMAERPHIKLTVIGMARLDAEREGLKRERLKALVAAERRASVGTNAGTANAADADAASATAARAASAPASAAALAASDADYAPLLRRLYRRSDIPGKPRNVIGMTRSDVPVAQMEALLLAHIDVSEDDIRQLATRRAVAIKDYLIAQHLDASRVFIGAIKTDDGAPPAASVAETASAAASAAAPAVSSGWTPHAELQLGAR